MKNPIYLDGSMNITNNDTMNETPSVYCYRDEVHTSYLTYIQLATIIVFKGQVMVGNVIANALVIYILVKTKQLSNIACKLIFMLSIPDLMIGSFGQN